MALSDRKHDGHRTGQRAVAKKVQVPLAFLKASVI